MSYKIISLLIPLLISSVARFPVFTQADEPNARPVLTFTPIDPGFDSSSSLPIGEDYFSCNTYGPFSLENPQDQDITFTYEFYSIPTQFIIERIRLLNYSGSVVASSAKTETYYYSGHRNSPTFTLPLRNYWTANGLTLIFEIVKSSDRSVLKSYSVSFYPPSNSFIAGTYLKRNTYTSNNLGFYGKDNALSPLYETYDFTRFGDYLDVDYYYRLNVSNNHFYYKNNEILNYQSAYLYFNDSDNLFPYYTHDDNDDIYIPLKLVKNNDTITFKYNRTFYINKRTLQISDTYRSGFVTTQDFYLPVNGRIKFNGKQIYFQLNQMGLDSLSTEIGVRYDTTKSLVGVCKDGDYCIIGGKR